jgi:ferritin-like metal-binding protein YciE
MKLKTLHDLLIDQLKDLYSAEHHIIKALPKMAKAANSEELRAGFEEHLDQTKTHVERLDKICEQLEVSPRGKACLALEGLVEEGAELMHEDAEPEVLDAGLIAAAQKVEYYEMAAYGCARTWAQQLGLPEVSRLLDETFQEEKATDEKLTQLAEQAINRAAANPPIHESVRNGKKGSRRRQHALAGADDSQ